MMKVNNKITAFVFFLFFALSFCCADSLRLKSGELLKGQLVSYSPKTVLFNIENNSAFKFPTESIDLLILSTSDVVIQLAKKNFGVSSFELIGITSKSLYLKDNEHLFCFNVESDSDITFSIQNEKGNISFYESEIDKLSPKELWNRILIASNSKSIIDWIDFSQFNLETNDVLFYEDMWNVMKKYIPSDFHNLLWQLMECYTDMEKNISALTDKSDFPLTQKRLREDFLSRVYRLLEKMNYD